MSVRLGSHSDDPLQRSYWQARLAVGCRDDRQAAWCQHTGNLSVQALGVAEVLMHIDHDYDIKRPSGEGKLVDVDMRDGIAKKFRHLGNALGIDLPPAPLAAGSPKLVVHGAVVVVAGDEQAARVVRLPH